MDFVRAKKLVEQTELERQAQRAKLYQDNQRQAADLQRRVQAEAELAQRQQAERAAETLRDAAANAEEAGKEQTPAVPDCQTQAEARGATTPRPPAPGKKGGTKRSGSVVPNSDCG